MNIRMGQYIPGDSYLHKMDPRIKMLSVIILLVCIFLIPISAKMVNLALLASMLLVILILILTSGVPFKKALSGLKPIVFLLTFTFFIQVFYINEGNLLASFDMSITPFSILAIILLIVFYQFTKRYVKFRMLYFFLVVFLVFFVQYIIPDFLKITGYNLAIYDVALLRSSFILIRITNVVLLTSLLTYTTSNIDLNYGMESLLTPLRIVKFPVEVVSMMLSLTLRSIPTLLGETEKIMKAQASRGVDFNESSLKDKIIQVISLLIPVFVISFKRADDLANAMEVRGYIVGARRTKVDEHKIGFNDYITLIIALLMLTGIILFRVFL